jgi:hypothetical protein
VWVLLVVCDSAMGKDDEWVEKVLLGGAPRAFAQRIKFSFKRSDVLKLPIDRGEPNVCDLINPLQPFHRQFADLLRGNLGTSAHLNISFDLTDQAFKGLAGNWTLFKRLP